jgi:hypothetical protein
MTLEIIVLPYREKKNLGPQNGLESLGPKKTGKNSKFLEKCFEPVGIGGWKLISIWINPPLLGRNGLHCIECPHQMRKRLLNLAPGEPLTLVQELPYFDNSIKLNILVVSALDLCFHDIIIGCLFHAVTIELFWCQLLCYLRGVQQW